MSVNKNAQIRYQVLDKCFRNPGRKYFMDDLIEECNKALEAINSQADGISRRQLYEDIKYMKSDQGWQAPIASVRDGRKTFYRYDDLKFSINNQPLNDMEVQQLQSVFLFLSRFDGLPQLNILNDTIEKLQMQINSIHPTQKIIGFEQNPFLKGEEHFSTLFNAISYKQVLAVNYQSFKSSVEHNFIIHPYYLKQYNSRWFLLGYNAAFEDITNLALDRIINITATDYPYIESDIDFDEYFEDVIGVTVYKGRNTEKIVLHFQPDQSPYVKTKPLHGSQKYIEENENGLTIQLELITNYELEKLILSYGSMVKVLEPLHLKEKIKREMEIALETY